GPGSDPANEALEPWSKARLQPAFAESSDQFAAAARNASPELLASQRDSKILREQLPTVEDILSHLLTTHIGLHLGQLSAWRRAHGMDSILQV
ncbi:MAG: hypothetical protein MI861_26715, partial [Pirellulales bacterium]|nr:hypothetical protein [Pirellulales bacterium]